MKFKSDIETQAGLVDSFGFTGTPGQVLSSTGNKTEWITPPQSPGGGGSSQVFYFNGGTASSVGGYYQMSSVANTGAAADFTINANGYIASFLTDVASPNQLNIPAGNWNFEVYFSASSGGGSPSFYVELYKYSSSTFTLIASSSAAPEGITNGTAIDAYFTPLAVPTTTLLATDRLAVRVYVTHSGRTITMHTQNGNLSEVITTFSTGLTALNGLTEQVQYFAVGTGGTDFNIASATNTHTFNLPTASATNRGALSSANWTTFNDKQNALNGTGFVKVSGTTVSYDNSTYVPTSRTITINGSTQDLSANRTFNIDTGVTSFNTRTGAVTLTSSDVTTALGYTPVTQARTITINGVTQDLSANRTFTVTTPETDTLATVVARGDTTSGGRPIRLDTSGGGVYIKGSGGGWATGYYFTGSSNTYRGGFGALGDSDSLSNYWIGPAYNDYYTYIDSAQMSHTSSLRAPIFYDSADTGYYLNPNSISSLYGVAIRGDQSPLDTSNQLFLWGTGNSTTSAIGFKNNGGNFPNPTGNGDGYNTYLTMDSPGRGWVFREGAGGSNFTSVYTSGWILNNGLWQANASMRAPIFYDSNNTGYYVDPSGTSSFNTANFAGNCSWFGGYGSGSGPGLAFENQTSFARVVFWGLDFYDWNNGTQMVINDGYVLANNSMRSPIFYDSNDTGFYLDPASAGMGARIRGTVVIGGGTGGNYNEGLRIIDYNGFSVAIFGATGDAGAGRFNIIKTNGDTFQLRNAAQTVIWETNQSGNTTFSVDARSPIFYDSNNTGFYVDPSATSNLSRIIARDTITNSGGHYTSTIQNELPAAANGVGTGLVTLRQWCSEPGVTWDWAGFGYNVYNDGGSPNGFGRPNTSFGQAYMRMAPDGNWYFYNTNTGGTRYQSMHLTNAGNANFGGAIVASGDVTAFSDIRVKENVKTIDNALDKVLSLRGVTYNRIDVEDKTEKIGVIAQEIQEILPQVVREQEDGMLSVSYGNITAILIEAIKEQQKQMEELKELVNQLIKK